MATITSRVVQGKSLVVVRGRLQAKDLRRLERACGRALEQRDLALEVRLTDAEVGDEPSRLFLQHLMRRGARIT
jgi:hypothetical protein